MSGNYTARSNFKTRSRDVNIDEYFATNFTGTSLSAPSNLHGQDNPASVYFVANGGTVPNDRDFICDNAITGTDSETGYAPPTGTPLYATVLYGVYVIDYYSGFSLAGVADNTRAGVDTVATIAWEDVTIEGVATRAIVLTQPIADASAYAHASHSAGYRQQMWYTIYRNVTTGDDLTTASVSGYLWLCDLSDKYSSTHNRTSIIDWKTGSASLGGDFRVYISIIYANSADATEFGVAAGTLGFEIVVDNQANSSGPALTHEEFIRYKNYSVTIPQEDWFKFDLYVKRGASYSDTTTGRLVFRIKQGASAWETIADLNSETIAQYNIDHPSQALFPSAQNCRNIYMGERGNEWQRLFFGQYSKRLNKEFIAKFAKISFKDGLTD